MPSPTPHVVIIGAGFAGLAAARSLARAPVRISVVDRTNHHLFQPLLYQVATASLSPTDIAQPIRHILKRQQNVSVLLGEARAIDTASRTVTLCDGAVLAYDWLIVAAGAVNHYFNPAWTTRAPGLKTVPDALEIRTRFLASFEAAEREPDVPRRRGLLTFIVIGGGPTGVELAGAMAEIARRAMPRDFRSIDTTAARVILIEGGPRLLDAYSDDLARRAKDDLERLGVDVWLSTRVTAITDEGVELNAGDGRAPERIVTRNVFWAAGVRAAPLGAALGAPLDRGGRVLVNADLTIPNQPNVFVTGDLAAVALPGVDEQGRARFVPGIAPAAMQMGKHAATIIAREIQAPNAGQAPPTRRAFRYHDRGSLATIGRARAVGVLAGRHLTGLIAWLVWLAVHIVFLVGFRNRLIVLIHWAWAYFRYERGARLITEDVETLRKRAASPRV